MKRTASFVLALLLVLSLSACGAQRESAPGVLQRAVEQIRQHAQGGAQEFRLSSLPEIGEFVPGTAPAKSFFPDGPAETFTPRDDYGPLVPYVAEATYLRAPKIATWTDAETGEVYSFEQEIYEEQWNVALGLATADGRVVTKGLYGDYIYYEFQDGRGVYLLRNFAQEEDFEMPTIPSVLIDGEGRWSVDLGVTGRVETLFSYGLPLILVSSFYQLSFLVYDLDGRVYADLSRFGMSEEYYNDYPFVEFADGEGLLLSGAPDASGAWDYRALNFVGWDGSVVPETADYRTMEHSGGRALIVQRESDGYGLADVRGRLLTPEPYEYMAYSDLLGGFIGRLRNSRGTSDVRYFDKNGTPIRVNNAWTEDTLYMISEKYSQTHNYGVVRAFVDKRGGAAYDVRGNRLALPVGEGNVDFVEWVSGADDSYCVRRETDITQAQPPAQPERDDFIYIRTRDGKNLLCAADGTLLAEIETPRITRSSGSDTVYVRIFAQSGAVVVLTEDYRMFVYNADGEEIIRMEDFAAQTAGETDDRYMYVRFLCDWALQVYLSDETGFTLPFSRFYNLNDPSRTFGGFAYVSDLPGSRIAAITSTESILLDADGKERLRFTLPIFY